MTATLRQLRAEIAAEGAQSGNPTARAAHTKKGD
jgi:hypothetical protein